ncbi:hypothetical protein OC845_005067 [Tilletia horrida]|nr:hypothetical protein OC845_005067 [Tilletia horrida]
MSSSSAPTAPLLAFTESAQRQSGVDPSKAKKKKKASSKGKEKPKTAKVLSALAEARSQSRIKKKNKEALTFDDDARRDYLTGFQKRKTERKEAARKIIEERKKKEAKDARNAAREARKERAAENVKAERTALGLEDEDDDDDEEDEEEPSEAAEFESEEQHAVVTVETFDPDDPLGLDSQPQSLTAHSAATPTSNATDRLARKRQKIADSIPASSRRASKKEEAAKKAAASSTSDKVKMKKPKGPAAHGAGRLPQRMQAARGLSSMLDSSSRKARTVS